MYLKKSNHMDCCKMNHSLPAWQGAVQNNLQQSFFLWSGSLLYKLAVEEGS